MRRPGGSLLPRATGQCSTQTAEAELVVLRSEPHLLPMRLLVRVPKVRRTVDSLTSKSRFNDCTCTVSSPADQWVTGTPTSDGLRQPSATTFAASAPDPQRAGVPIVGRPQACQSATRNRSASSTCARCARGPRQASRCPTSPRRQPSARRLAVSWRHAARCSEAARSLRSFPELPPATRGRPPSGHDEHGLPKGVASIIRSARRPPSSPGPISDGRN